MKLLNVSEKERELLIKEVSERMKDTIFANAKDQARVAVTAFLEDMAPTAAPNDDFIIEYKVNFVVNDLIQIVSSIRRGRLKG